MVLASSKVKGSFGIRKTESGMMNCADVNWTRDGENSGDVEDKHAGFWDRSREYQKDIFDVAGSILE